MNCQDDLRQSYPMNRRTFVSMVAAGAASALFQGAAAAAQPAPKAQNVVLVHGLFADGSCWSDVIRTVAGGRAERHRRAEPADDAGGRGGGNSAGSGAAGWADRAG